MNQKDFETMMQINRLKSKPLIISIGALFMVLVGAALAGGLWPSAVKVIDARVTFKFTAYPDKDEHFVSYSLENKRKDKTKVLMRVQLVENGLKGFFGGSAANREDSVLLEPLETRSFVLKMEIPKSKKERHLNARVKVKRTSRV